MKSKTFLRILSADVSWNVKLTEGASSSVFVKFLAKYFWEITVLLVSAQSKMKHLIWLFFVFIFSFNITFSSSFLTLDEPSHLPPSTTCHGIKSSNELLSIKWKGLLWKPSFMFTFRRILDVRWNVLNLIAKRLVQRSAEVSSNLLSEQRDLQIEEVNTSNESEPDFLNVDFKWCTPKQAAATELSWSATRLLTRSLFVE